MKRPLKAEEARLWARVAKTVRLAPGRTVPEPPLAREENSNPVSNPLIPAKAGAQSVQTLRHVHPGPSARGDERDLKRSRETHRLEATHPIEPLRKRRLARERDEIEARLDLHGLDQDRAHAVLHDFLLRAHGRGVRAVLVITGKGSLGDGVLRRRTPEWLAEPRLRPIIAGVSPAARHHGGEGALYIALKRRPT